METQQTRKRADIWIRWMVRRDMPEVLEIERNSFDDPWPEAEFTRHLQRRNCIGHVAECKDRVIGFTIYELHPDHLRILNLAIAKDHRRKGVGRQMVDRLISKLSPTRRRRLAVNVVETNLDGHLFFRDCGFRATGVAPCYYDNDRDAYCMELGV